MIKFEIWPFLEAYAFDSTMTPAPPASAAFSLSKPTTQSCCCSLILLPTRDDRLLLLLLPKATRSWYQVVGNLLSSSSSARATEPKATAAGLLCLLAWLRPKRHFSCPKAERKILFSLASLFSPHPSRSKNLWKSELLWSWSGKNV